MSVTILAPAKINLFLGVGARRPDGYHDVVTVMQAIALTDSVTVSAADELQLLTDADFDVPDAQNLAVRGVLALATETDREPRVRIELAKSIPSGAGLGGGSSDAAAAILGAAMLWGIDARDPALVAAARSVGADVPFFLQGGAALLGGRGDVLERELPSARTDVVVVKPPAAVPTQAAYAAFDAAPVVAGEPLGVIEALELGDVAALGGVLDNNLAEAAAAVVPEVAQAVALVRGADGVLGALVSGSGSAVFGLCESADSAMSIAEAAQARGWWAEATMTYAWGVHPVEGEA